MVPAARGWQALPEPAAQGGLSRARPQPCAGDGIPGVDLKGISFQVWLLQMRHAPGREGTCLQLPGVVP